MPFLTLFLSLSVDVWVNIPCGSTAKKETNARYRITAKDRSFVLIPVCYYPFLAGEILIRHTVIRWRSSMKAGTGILHYDPRS